MGESSRRNLWKRSRRSTCEGGTSKLPSHIHQDTKQCYKIGYPERKHKEMVKPVEGNNENVCHNM